MSESGHHVVQIEPKNLTEPGVRDAIRTCISAAQQPQTTVMLKYHRWTFPIDAWATEDAVFARVWDQQRQWLLSEMEGRQ